MSQEIIDFAQELNLRADDTAASHRRWTAPEKALIEIKLHRLHTTATPLTAVPRWTQRGLRLRSILDQVFGHFSNAPVHSDDMRYLCQLDAKYAW